MGGGKKPRPSCMGWIGVEPKRNITLRESELTAIWSFVTREFGPPPEERRQMTVVHPDLVHSPPTRGVAHHRLVCRTPDGAEAPSASGEGGAGWPRGTGACLAPSPAPLVQWQSPGRETSGRQQGNKTPGVDGIIWDTPEKKAYAIPRAEAARLSPSATTAHLHSQE